MLALAAVAVSTIWVSSPEPVAACELGVGVRDSLRELMPEVAVELDGEAALRLADAARRLAQGDGEVVLRVEAGEGGGVRVVIVDAAGAEVMARELPARGACGEMADAVALIVERYLSDLAWQPEGVAVAPLPEPVVETIVVPEPEPEPEPAVRAPALRGDVAARALVALGPTQAGADAAVTLGRRWLRVGVEVGALWPREESVVRDGGAMIGEVRMSSLHALAGAGVAQGRAAAALWAGGERVGAAAAGDAVFQRADQAAWQTLIRGDLGYGVPVTGRLSLRVAAGVEWRPQPVEIQVEGASRAYASPRLRAVVGAGVSWRFR